MSSTEMIKLVSADDDSPAWDLPPKSASRNPSVDNRDLGDRGTWLLIGLMCAAGLVVALTAYLLPMGQHAVMPSIGVR